MSDVRLTQMPGVHWREVLARTLAAGEGPTVGELLVAVAPYRAGLADVAGWLCDEIRMGRAQAMADGDDAAAAGPRYCVRV